MKIENEKLLCLTLDLERDYGHFETYEAFNNLDELLALLKKYDLKLTVFLVGNLLEKKKEVIEKLRGSSVEFALHSFAHNLSAKDSQFKCSDIIQAKNAYFDYFKTKPLGYRAPRGAISLDEIGELFQQGFEYDSSIFPYWRPGFYNNLNLPTSPFRWKNGLLEIPLSGLKLLRFPISLSYIQFFGWRFYKFWLSIFGWPSLLVSDIHLHNLKKTRSVKGAPWFARVFYFRNQNQGLAILEDLILLAKKKGYQTAFLSEINQKYEKFIPKT